MDTQDIPKLSSLAERLGWAPRMSTGRVSTGIHVVDVLQSRSATDLISLLADSRER
ncbi:hypothetical protein Lesp02_57340 [Lentzea sp. NBRC 105346]|uniref:hypothetical protein n=1 Tax=Lentzea sp. NBRC 105346 TaxID=3032205 RepID=UPI0024A27618|nr:hypothetical protein [Lentzea sp. NBRC 105346]GLZ33546.1 hypothetical protein Lesp02_57340 [Lentzea sp. NBRC 105346]